MFETIKKKAKKTKDWVKENELELKVAAYGVVCYTAGLLVMGVIDYHYDKKGLKDTIKKYPDEVKVLSMRQHADNLYSGSGNGGPTVDNLSKSMIDYGIPAESKVVGLLMYTKNK